MLWVMQSKLLPGWQADITDGMLGTIDCARDPGHTRAQRDWACVDFLEPPRPQKRILPGADVLAVQGFGAFLLRDALTDDLAAARLTGWTAEPARITMRDGAVNTSFLELRIAGVAGIAGRDAGAELLQVCPDCGLRSYARSYRFDIAARAAAEARLDFAVIWPSISLHIVSEKARRVLERFRVDDIDFVPVDKMATPRRLGEGAVPPFYSDATRAAIDRCRAIPPRAPGAPGV